jgi:hemerythrin-like domain-containing protein
VSDPTPPGASAGEDQTASTNSSAPTDADVLEAAWSASATVREFSGIHRMIRGFVHVLMPTVASMQSADATRVATAARAMLFAVEGIRFHHSPEDLDYWPALVANGADESALEPLKREHSELDPIVDQLDDQVRRLQGDPTDGPALDASKALFRHLGEHTLSHLDHEEPIFFPLLVQYLPDDQAATLAKKAAKNSPRKGISWVMAGATYAMRPKESAEFLHALPKPIVWSRPLPLRRYRKDCAILGINPTALSGR